MLIINYDIKFLFSDAELGKGIFVVVLIATLKQKEESCNFNTLFW